MQQQRTASGVGEAIVSVEGRKVAAKESEMPE